MTQHRHLSRNRLAALAALACFWSGEPQAEAALDRVLEGAEGDRVTILLAAGQGGAGLPVTLCLFDGTEDVRAKAFDIRTTQNPRFWTQGNGEPACGGISDTDHTVSFFTRRRAGTVREILRTRLDLGSHSGRRVDLIWTVTGP